MSLSAKTIYLKVKEKNMSYLIMLFFVFTLSLSIEALLLVLLSGPLSIDSQVTKNEYKENCTLAYVCFIASIFMIIDTQISNIITPHTYWWPLWIFILFGIFYGLYLVLNKPPKPPKKIDVIPSQNGLSKS